MVESTEVILINPPIIDFDQQRYLEGRRKHVPDITNVLNYGLLSIASYLENNEVSVRILDSQNTYDFDALRNHLKKENPEVIGLSCVSCLAYIPSLEITRVVSEECPNAKIAIGGQHITSLGKEVFKDSDEIDYVCVGDGEKTLLEIVTSLKEKAGSKQIRGCYSRSGKIRFGGPQTPLPLEELNEPNYRLFPGFRNMFPQIEESRGCNFNCAFCSNKANYPLHRGKKALTIFHEIERICELYNTDEPKLVFLCSNFGMNPKNTAELISRVKSSPIRPECLASQRVDTCSAADLKNFDVLFKQVRFGIESASPQMLKRMNKTQNPQRYLLQAKTVFKELKQQGIIIEANFLLGYIGETPETLNETLRFIFSERNLDSIWPSPLMCYPGSGFRTKLGQYKTTFGTTVVKTEFYDKIKAYPINPSTYYTYAEIRELCSQISKIFNSEEMYYNYLKWTYPPQKKLEFIQKDTIQKDIQKVKSDIL